MKKKLGIVAGIVGIISVIVGVALKMNNNAIAIIGGAISQRLLSIPALLIFLLFSTLISE